VQPKIKVLRIIDRMNVSGPAVQISNLMRRLNPKIFDQKLITSYCEQNEIDYLELNVPEIPCTRIKGFGHRVSFKEDSLDLVPVIIKGRTKPKINKARFDYWATCQINDSGMR
jgi:hypothetical protein